MSNLKFKVIYSNKFKLANPLEMYLSPKSENYSLSLFLNFVYKKIKYIYEKSKFSYFNLIKNPRQLYKISSPWSVKLPLLFNKHSKKIQQTNYIFT